MERVLTSPASIRLFKKNRNKLPAAVLKSVSLNPPANPEITKHRAVFITVYPKTQPMRYSVFLIKYLKGFPARVKT